MHNIVHVPFCYFPDAVGGTEIYVRDLAREQLNRGHAVMVLAPADGPRAYTYDNVPVVRYTVSNQIADVRDLYTADKTDVEQFVDAVERFGADIVHIHGVGRAIAPTALERLKQGGVHVVLTYHTPTTSCVRGTLLQHGTHPCDGVLDAPRCTACALTSHGLPLPIANAVAHVPSAAVSLLRTGLKRGRVITALRMHELVTVRHDLTRRLLELSDQVVAPAQWVSGVLRNLGVPEHNIAFSRQGVRRIQATQTRRSSDKLRLVYVGRIDPVKGIHLLTQALRMLAAAKLELHVYGVVQAQTNDRYHKQLQRDFAQDARVFVHPPVAPDEVVDVIAQYDVLVAPSQWLETGPLVVLEAFAAGLPVIGSNLGGIAELVEHGVDGLLVDTPEAAGWAQAFRTLLDDPQLLERLRSGVRPPRSMATVAEEMDAVYAKAMQA